MNIAVLLALLLFFAPVLYARSGTLPARRAQPTAIVIKTGFRNNHIAETWKNALSNRMDQHTLDSLAGITRPLSAEEQAWQTRIHAKATRWNSFRDSLAVPFRDISLPDTVFVLLGFTGNDDGFTFEDRTVCIDLTALYRAYGKAELQENDNRIDRIFAHEYTHLLHKAWARKANWQPQNFRDSILWECFYEGIGMYRSFNARWMPVEGVLPEITISTLEELYPVFVDRITTILTKQTFTSGEKALLNSRLSRGAVNQKWGAFTVGIWLALEANGNDQKLIPIIEQGPGAVIRLAQKYLPVKYFERMELAWEK